MALVVCKVRILPAHTYSEYELENVLQNCGRSQVARVMSYQNQSAVVWIIGVIAVYSIVLEKRPILVFRSRNEDEVVRGLRLVK